MPVVSDEEVWQWVDSGTPGSRGRVHHRKVSVYRENQPHKKRVYRIGDPVVMAGENGGIWIGHLVDMFQAPANDACFRDENNTHHPPANPHECMRVTFRWFYQFADMNHLTLNHSRTHKPLKTELWFSDHVEMGTNDVQVIEGKAWLFQREQDMSVFQRDPHRDFIPTSDEIRLVRCFVNSNDSDALPVRELERDELKRLLQNPTPDTDLYGRSRTSMYAHASAVLKGTGNNNRRKHRSRTLREPVNLVDDEFQPQREEADKKNRDQAAKRKKQSKLDVEQRRAESSKRRQSHAGRRKVIDDDDDDDDDHYGAAALPDMDDPPPVHQSENGPASLQDVEQANEEVLDFIHELNSAARNDKYDNNTATVEEPSRPEPRQQKKPISNRQRQRERNGAVEVVEDTRYNQARERRIQDANRRQKKTVSSNPIIIDIDDDDEDFQEPLRLNKKQPQKADTAEIISIPRNISARPSDGQPQKSSNASKTRRGFMPTGPRGKKAAEAKQAAAKVKARQEELASLNRRTSPQNLYKSKAPGKDVTGTRDDVMRKKDQPSKEAYERRASVRPSASNEALQNRLSNTDGDGDVVMGDAKEQSSHKRVRSLLEKDTVMRSKSRDDAKHPEQGRKSRETNRTPGKPTTRSNIESDDQDAIERQEEVVRHALLKIRALHDNLSVEEQKILRSCFDICLQRTIETLCDGDTITIDDSRKQELILDISKNISHTQSRTLANAPDIMEV